MTAAVGPSCALPNTPLAAAGRGLTCVHCGFCLQACPTYFALGTRMTRPRGRLVLMRALLEGTSLGRYRRSHAHRSVPGMPRVRDGVPLRRTLRCTCSRRRAPRSSARATAARGAAHPGRLRAAAACSRWHLAVRGCCVRRGFRGSRRLRGARVRDGHARGSARPVDRRAYTWRGDRHAGHRRAPRRGA